MLLNGFVLGAITFAGWATVFHKLPDNMKDVAAKYSLVTDGFFTFVTYFILSDTIVSLLACAWVGLLFECYMYIRRNKEDLDWLYDSVDRIKDSFESVKQMLREKNEAYKKTKARRTVQAVA